MLLRTPIVLLALAACNSSSSPLLPTDAAIDTMVATVDASCTVGSAEGCQAGNVCMNDTNGPACVAVPDKAPLDLALPFDAATTVVCTHSSGSGSHSYPNAFYALDFDSPYDLPAVTIRAAGDGKAFVFGSTDVPGDGSLCAETVGTPKDEPTSTCGDSWGNRIKILHADGYYTLYAHLDHALIANGTMVHSGDAIGVEGWTGEAGSRQLHWSVNRLPGVSESDWEQKIGWIGQSVPFDFQARMNGELRVFNSPDLSCPHAKIGDAPNQPTLSGAI